jgi:hypothetical protein
MANAEAGLRALLAELAGALDEDVVDYVVSGLVDAASDEPDGAGEELVAEVAGPFLEEQLAGKALSEFCRRAAAVFTDFTGPAVAAAGAEDEAEHPAEQRLAGSIRIGDAAEAEEVPTGFALCSLMYDVARAIP